MFSLPAYQSVLEELFQRFPSVQNVPFSQGYKPGFDRMREFDAILGAPASRLRCIHVAGTNGKGSVANMLASALASTGASVGLYTSPHILDFRERMRIVSGPGRSVPALVPKEYVYDFITRYRKEFERLDLSFFEITTGLAFKWMADSKVDWAVIEVGLGGRLDSTNIITPALSVVTSIGLDHCALLGNTLGEIAAEKAGIFKSGVPALVGERRPETEPVFARIAESAGAPLHFACDMALEGIPLDDIYARMDLQGAGQQTNLRTVLSALDILQIPVTQPVQDAIVHTASRMDFHGRWERLCTSPEVICDIGHNAAALEGNFRRLEASGKRLIIVYAVMADKDLGAILPLMPRQASYIFTTPKTRRALPAEDILARFLDGRDICDRAETESALHDGKPVAAHGHMNGRGPKDPKGLLGGTKRSGGFDACNAAQWSAIAVDSVKDAVAEAMENADGDTLVYIGGSTFAVAEAIPLFREGKYLNNK